MNRVKTIEEKTLDLAKQQKSFTGKAQSGKYCVFIQGIHNFLSINVFQNVIF